MTFLVNNLNLGFVHIPKNCGTSIRHWFYTNRCSITDVGHHSTLPELSLPDNFKSVAVIRNPWDRTVSFYHFCKRLIDTNAHGNGGAAVKGISEPYPDFESWLDNIQNVYFVPGRDFGDLRHPFWFTPSTPQTVWIPKDPSLLIRYEELDKGLEQLQEITGITSNIPRLNVTPHEPYTTYYNDRTRSIVAKIFALDIERWNYSF